MPRAMLFHGPGRPLQLVHADAPGPRGAEICVRVACCALCTSDLHTHAGRRSEPLPTVLGHEIVGRIEAFGPDAPRADLRGVPLHEGDRITWTVAASCGACFYCSDGLPQKCTHLFKYGHAQVTPAQPWAGGLADHVVLRPGTSCLKLPDSVPDTLAAVANCATATAAALLRLAGPMSGRAVVIFGAGILGLTACAMARAAAARAVIVCDTDEARRARAVDFGATDSLSSDTLAAAVSAATDGRGADVVLELAGAAAAVEASLALGRVGGTVLLAGTVMPTAAVPLDPERVVRRMLTIRGVHNYTPIDLAAAVDFLATHSGPFARLIGPTFELAGCEAAFIHAHAHPGERVVVMPDGTMSAR